MPCVSPKVYFLLESKPTEELERIYKHLVDLLYRLIFNRDIGYRHIDRFLIYQINDILYYRYVVELERIWFASEYVEGC